MAIFVTTLAGGAVVASFAAGVRVWSAAREFARTEEAAFVELSVWSRDVMNARRFRKIPFEGDAQSMAFAVVQPMRASAVVTEPAVLGKVRYWHDDRTQVLYRHVRAFPASGPWHIHEAERWIDQVASVTFEYLPDPENTRDEPEPIWQSTWQDEERPPFGVRLRLTRVDGTSRVRTVVLPKRKWRRQEEAVP